ncbi:MAG TPA: hypothetical protein VMZ28_13535 [Kofleriaceae bacterium]|nr:hypothetical protein [Kofleriaceae bacterium]
MTDVARRSALNQKQRLDEALLERRRRDALADLGETLHELVRSGELDIDELPELQRGVEAVDDIDQQIAEAEAAQSGRGARRPVRLTRNDAPADWSREGRGSRQRPPGRSRESIGRDDQPRVVGPPPVEPRVWRPGVGAPVERPASAAPADAPAPRSDGGGGIVFLDDDAAAGEPDPDESLESYMNDEDVPRRG